ncbi:hypothetical protein BV898_16488 [Hypsibius exemplaris]|uniref:G-protein coupled receptors family 1 profile domain-containing protein n=1 Tax=Hypsibius exemplaris TaxID=2072580 RepID=A0A9X6NDC3_HYPEX|nr:hypothetical protein BV898_16488 [Hypsibius exemplaris]
MSTSFGFINETHKNATQMESISKWNPPPWILYNKGLLIWFVITVIVCVITGAGNIVLLVVTVKSSFLRIGAGLIIAHLALLECFASWINMPVNVINTFTIQFDMRPSRVGCAASQFLLVLTYTAANWTMVKLAVNRFIAFCFPHFYHHMASRMAVAFSIGSIWLIAVLLNAPFLFGSMNQFSLAPPCRDGKKRKNLARRAVNICVLFGCWFAYCLCYFTNTIINKFDFTIVQRNPVVQLWTKTAVILGYAIHPLFLFTMSQEYRRGMRELYTTVCSVIKQTSREVTATGRPQNTTANNNSRSGNERNHSSSTLTKRNETLF